MPIQELPSMTNAEIFFGPKDQLDNDYYWFRAFKALPGKPYQAFLHIYVASPITSKKEFVEVLKDCIPNTFRVMKLPTPDRSGGQKQVLSCCPKKHWNKATKDCSRNRLRGGSGPLFYKVMIPEDDISRLMEVGQIRPAIKPIKGLSVKHQVFESKHKKSDKSSIYTIWLTPTFSKPLLNDKGEVITFTDLEMAEEIVKKTREKHKITLYIKEETKIQNRAG